MSIEAEIGAQWLDDHTISTEGVRDSGTRLAWQLGVMARWLAFGELTGITAGAGVHFFRIGLDEAPLQVLGGELRLGKYFWRENDTFLLLEFGYAVRSYRV